MNEITYNLTDDYIELYKLIKILDLVDTGGQAKLLIENHQVKRDGIIETRKRAKIKKGECIMIGDEVKINVI